MKKKFISALLCIAMIIAIIPSAMTTLFAGEPTTPVYAVLTSTGLFPADESGKQAGDTAITDKTTITNLIVDATVTTIGKNAFMGCTNLTTVDFSNATTLTTIGIQAFSDCTNLTTVDLSNAIILTTIAINAFACCTSLTTIDFPNATSLETIGVNAFFQCTSLTTVTIPSTVKLIDMHAFADCTSLTEIKFDGENTNYTAENGVLFNKNKTELIQYPAGKIDTSYTIPASVTTIDAYAFMGCENLTTVTLPTILETIGECAFDGCKSLAEIKFDGENT
ncbi:MAG: leucine-rich repeat protein, partial [Oscillospiraceae bacterium]